MQPQDVQLLVLKEEKKELVMCLIFQIQVVYSGAPCKFHSSCGREFANDVFCEMN